MGRLARLLRHWCTLPSQRRFPADSLARIAGAIAAGERRHRGEVCFAIESALGARQVLGGVDARRRADEAFGCLRVWDTAANNGVLVYVLLADHAIEIVADRGLDGRVDAAQWRAICALMEERFRAGEHERAAIAGIEAVSDLLAEHFPQDGTQPDEDELPNRPRLL
ncbi:TPM domain-containing protein [Luteimonas marina]|uniref:TPM domain-containing protein n=1 Tax=Luteimonas marina TaxID=488485 RepID=UPI001EE29101|nr:TPM domain-containing protein [Luteimonas marina]